MSYLVTMVAKVQIKNVRSVLKSIERVFDDTLKRLNLYDELSTFTVDRIKAETRKGRDLSREGAPIQDTSDGTKNIKELIERGVIKINPPTPLFFRSNKSQITQTGQLLDSLEGSIDRRSGEITIEPTGKRQPANYVWAKTGKPVDFLNESQVQSNKSLAKELADRGFTFLGLDKKGVKRIRRLVLDEIRRLIRRLR